MAKSCCSGSLWSLVILVCFVPIAVCATETRKLDESAVPGTGEKCTPCAQGSPPPPPPPPPPVPCPPPPAPKKPPSIYCPPPPPSNYIYISGPPGSLYPIDQYFSGAEKAVVGRGCWISIWIGLIGVMFLR